MAQVDALVESYFGVLEDVLGMRYSPATCSRQEHWEMVSFDLDEHFGIQLDEARVPVLWARVQRKFEELEERIENDPRPPKEVLGELNHRFWLKFAWHEARYGHYLARLQG